MKAAWTVPAFTPAKFALLALAAIAATLGADGVSAPHQSAANAVDGLMLRPIDAVAKDFGSYTDTEFLITAPPPTHVPDHGGSSAPTPAPIVRRPYPPLAR